MFPDKKPITEVNAAAAIMDGVFNQVDERWGQVWEPLSRLVAEAGFVPPKLEFAKFNFSLAALAVNFRAAFDLMPRDQAERIFLEMLRMMEQQLGSGSGNKAVQNAILKYVEAYNNGIIAIRNPLQDVAMLFYYKIGLSNTPQVVVDETYYTPDPRVVDYTQRAMTMFVGRWEYLLERYEVMAPGG